MMLSGPYSTVGVVFFGSYELLLNVVLFFSVDINLYISS